MKITPLEPSFHILRFYSSTVSAGFPSPADDYLDKGLSLDELLIKHPSATYLARANGNSMTGCGIFHEDILIIDRSLTAQNGDIVVAAVDGELTCKRIDTRRKMLLSENPNHPHIKINILSDVVIEGVVVSSIRTHRYVRSR